MALELATSSNKPPSPDDELFTDLLKVGNRWVWRSLPQPDHLTLTGWLRKEHFKGYASTPDKHDAYAFQLAKAVHAQQLLYNEAGGYLQPVGGSPRKMMEARIPLGERGSRVFITMERIKVPDAAATNFKLRLDLNPRKLGDHGSKTLFKLLNSEANTPFDFGHFLHDAWMTRLDVALDFADLRPAETLIWAKKQGKVVRILGADEELESVYLHGTKKAPAKEQKTLKSPMGALIVRVYDRNRERQAHGKPVPYEGRLVTRLERSMTKKSNHSSSPFIALLHQPDPFKDVRFGLMRAAQPSLMKADRWRTYCAARQAVGPKEARAITCNSKAEGDALEAAYSKRRSHLLAGDYWKGWLSGVKATGLLELFGPALALHSATRQINCSRPPQCHRPGHTNIQTTPVTMKTKSYVSYLRCSTERQHLSGLGLEAQREAVTVFATGRQIEIVAEYVEGRERRKGEPPPARPRPRSC